MKSSAATVSQYIADLPEDRTSDIKKVRSVIKKNLPKGYEEVMNWGMITYQVPLSVYPDTYNKQPLAYAALASQKNYMSLYLNAVYMDPAVKKAFEEEYRSTGKKMDMGKSCLRFKSIDDLPLDLVAKTIASVTMEEYVQKAKAISHDKKKAK